MLLEKADAMAQRFAAGPTRAFQRIKTFFNESSSRSLDEQLAIEAVAQAELGDTQDFADAVTAFRAKRPPTFSGR